MAAAKKKPFKYEELTEEDRSNIARQQVRQFEQERFSHEMNIVRLEAQKLRAPKAEHRVFDEQIQGVKDTIATIDGAIGDTRAEADKLAAPAKG